MRLRLVLALITVLALTGCPSPTPAPDVGSDADAAIDVVEPGDGTGGDAAGDTATAELPPTSCMPCLYDQECGPGGACVEAEPVQPPWLRHCLVACASPGEPCSAGGVPGRCEPGPAGTPVCMPGGACVRSQAGAPCDGPDACAGRYGLCGSPDRARTPERCLARCSRDSDCEDDFARCRPVALAGGGSARACIRDEVVGPERCGAAPVNDRGVGAPCGGATGARCGPGLECIEGRAPGVAGFCAAPCAADGDCGGGARCLPVGGAGGRCVPPDCECVADGGDALLDRALLAGGRHRCELFFARRQIDVFPRSITRDRFRLPAFDRIHRDWLAGARWARALGPALDARAATLSGLIAAADGVRTAGDAGAGRAGAPVAPLEDEAPLAEATARLIEAFGARADRAALRADAADVPVALQRALSSVLVALTRAAQARDRGLGPFARPEDAEGLFDVAPHMVLAGRFSLSPREPADLGAMLGDVELPVAEAVDLAATVEAVDWARFRDARGPSFDAPTPVGRVVVRDGEAHTYEQAAYAETALVVDLGGDDVYRAPVGANASARNRVSVLVDLGGADRYGYTERPVALDAGGFLPSDGAGRNAGPQGPYSRSEVNRQGAGRLGVGLLYDLGGGDDEYRSLRGSQGFGAFGVGALFDDGGDDVYVLEAGGQGAGIFGIGVALDAGGADRYTGWFAAQGFAYVRGVGILYDRDGADAYLAPDTPVAYPSAQDNTVNNSMVQGVGFGRRADFTADRVSMSGGVGVLRDRAGADRYRCAIFGQGSGYWGGAGVLLDGGGDDGYDGRWYVQGASAHFAYGALVDGGGRDVHNGVATRQNMTAGAGHDYSLGLLLADGPEADEYNVPNLALGAGNDNGAGLFGDEGGDDVYRASSALSCGNAATGTELGARRMLPCTGIFLDGQGADVYSREGVATDPVRNDASWTQRVHADHEAERGVGADGAGAPLGL